MLCHRQQCRKHQPDLPTVDIALFLYKVQSTIYTVGAVLARVADGRLTVLSDLGVPVRVRVGIQEESRAVDAISVRDGLDEKLWSFLRVKTVRGGPLDCQSKSLSLCHPIFRTAIKAIE